MDGRISAYNTFALNDSSQPVGDVRSPPTENVAAHETVQQTESANPNEALAARRGMDISAYKRHTLQNNFAASQTINDPEKPIFPTIGGAWRKGADDKPAFYRTGADISGTTLVDTEYYKPPADKYLLSAAGKWVRLNPRGGLQTLPENKDKPRPDNISAFDWQGYEWLDAPQVPADYSSEGKTISFADPKLAENQLNALKRYVVDDNLVKTWDEAKFQNLFESAAGTKIRLELTETGKTADGKTLYAVKMNDESLKNLRENLSQYNREIEVEKKAGAQGQQEATNMAGDTAKVIGRAVVNTVEGTANTILEIIDPSIRLDPHNLTRARIGDVMDSQLPPPRNGAREHTLPRVDLSAIKPDYKSELFNRDVFSGKVNPDGITVGKVAETAVEIAAPMAAGKVFSIPKSPQTLKSLGILPESEVATAQTVSHAAQKVGRIEIEQGRKLSSSEQRFADKMVAEGKVVKAKVEVNQPNVKNPDFEIDNEIVEFKYVSDLKGATADKLSARLSGRILDGGSQASKVSLDVINQAGMTREIAERAIGRAFGNQASRLSNKIQEVRIYGQGFDITMHFTPK